MTAPTPGQVDANRIEFCTCPEGVYYGAQQVGTVPQCERCRRLPNDGWVHAALAASLPTEVMLAALVERGALTERQANARLNEDGSLTIDAYRQYCNAKARRLVTPWEVVP